MNTDKNKSVNFWVHETARVSVKGAAIRFLKIRVYPCPSVVEK
jgi:hypothetical protein